MEKVMWLCVTTLLLINSANALMCYFCNTGTNNECRYFNPERSVIPCGRPHPDFIQYCMFKNINDRQHGREIVAATCETARKPQYFNMQNFEREQCQFGSRYSVYECRICTTDLCNHPTLNRRY